MYSLFLLILFAVLSRAAATPVANNQDTSDYVTNYGYFDTDSAIIAQPDCGGLMIKCCLGLFNPVTHYAGRPCGTCNVAYILPIPRSHINWWRSLQTRKISISILNSVQRTQYTAAQGRMWWVFPLFGSMRDVLFMVDLFMNVLVIANADFLWLGSVPKLGGGSTGCDPLPGPT